MNNKVQLLKWVQSEDGARELITECTHTGHVLALYVATRGDFILVGEHLEVGSRISQSGLWRAVNIRDALRR